MSRLTIPAYCDRYALSRALRNPEPRTNNIEATIGSLILVALWLVLTGALCGLV